MLARKRVQGRGPLAADILRRETGSDALLEQSRDGEAPLLPLIDDIVARERALVGERKDRILAYIGYRHLVQGSRYGPASDMGRPYPSQIEQYLLMYE